MRGRKIYLPLVIHILNTSTEHVKAILKKLSDSNALRRILIFIDESSTLRQYAFSSLLQAIAQPLKPLL